MRKADAEKYRKALLSLKQRLTGNVTGMRREALEKGDSPSIDHLADHGSDHFEQDLTLALLENGHGTIQAIDDALARLEGGTFGACEICERPIPKARLDALPHARLCLSCQEVDEQNRG